MPLLGESPPHGSEWTHALYRLYARTGELIYVGATYCFQERMEQHARSSSWWAEVDDAFVVFFPGRAALLAEEARVIRRSRPRHNVYGVSKQTSRGRK